MTDSNRAIWTSAYRIYQKIASAPLSELTEETPMLSSIRAELRSLYYQHDGEATTQALTHGLVTTLNDFLLARCKSEDSAEDKSAVR